MRIAVIGAGGVGGYFGARLAQAGNDVAFVARGAHLAAIRAHGLRIDSPRGDTTVANVTATDDPGSLPPCDVVMLCVKLWDVEAAARQALPLLAGGGVIIPFENGVDAPEILQRVVGAQQVLGGIAYIAAVIREPGVIAHTGMMARLVVGAFEDGNTAAATEFSAACAAAGFDAEVSPDIRRALWEKFGFLTGMAGCTALVRQPLGFVRSDPDVRRTFEAAVREVWLVGRAQGVRLADDYVERQLGFLDSLPAEMRSSMLNDLVAGNRLEAPWLTGAVVRLGAAAGVATPVVSTLLAAMKPYINGTKA
jgi:2-dehydropantoate 2-reductase